MLGTALLPRGDGLVLAPLPEAVFNLDSTFAEEEQSRDAKQEATECQVTECEPSAI